MFTKTLHKQNTAEQSENIWKEGKVKEGMYLAFAHTDGRKILFLKSNGKFAMDKDLSRIMTEIK